MIAALPGRRAEDLQPTLFEVDRPLASIGVSRSWVGDFFEEATARLTGATRLKTDGRFPWCPDLVAGDRAFIESKGVGQSGQMILYEGRTKKDVAHLRRRRASMDYFVWRHTFLVTQAKTLNELRAGVAGGVRKLVIIGFDRVWATLRDRPTRRVNNGVNLSGKRNGYGSDAKGYGIGWTISVNELQRQTVRVACLIPVAAYGVTMPTFEVWMSDPGKQGRYLR